MHLVEIPEISLLVMKDMRTDSHTVSQKTRTKPGDDDPHMWPQYLWWSGVQADFPEFQARLVYTEFQDRQSYTVRTCLKTKQKTKPRTHRTLQSDKTKALTNLYRTSEKGIVNREWGSRDLLPINTSLHIPIWGNRTTEIQNQRKEIMTLIYKYAFQTGFGLEMVIPFQTQLLFS